MPKKIFIGGLSATATETRLEQLFAPFGVVLTTQVVAGDEGQDETSAYGQTVAGIVTFSDDEAGDRAIRDMNGAEVDGHTITVTPD